MEAMQLKKTVCAAGSFLTLAAFHTSVGQGAVLRTEASLGRNLQVHTLQTISVSCAFCLKPSTTSQNSAAT